MFYINKIVGWCMSPLGMFFIVLSASFVLKRKPRFKKIGLIVALSAVAGLWFLSTGLALRCIGYPLEGDEIDLSVLPQADAVVLLGGGMALHEKCGSPEIWCGADRVWAAARLMKTGKAPIVTVSGGGAAGEIAFLTDMGVDKDKIIRFDTARNTEEEAKLIAKAINAQGTTSTPHHTSKPKILLVTSAWHMPRAKMLFERAGFEIVPAPTDYEFHCQAETPIHIKDFFPYADILERNSYAIKEWVARFCYWLKG